jgi:hypothetical protein
VRRVSCWNLPLLLTGQASLICRQRQGWKPLAIARPYPLLPVREVSSPVPPKNAFRPRWDLLEILCEEQRHEDSCGNSQYTTRHACRCQGKMQLLHFSIASREILTFLLDKYPQFVLRGKSRVSEQSNSKYRPIRSKYLSINLFLCPQIGAHPYSAVLIPRVYGASSFFFSKKRADPPSISPQKDRSILDFNIDLQSSLIYISRSATIITQ